ncbi:MAG: ABC transporter ATP-binding protein, partial [Chloroflexi bacterium]|nr:ABC transporter ATP-binding protein [Chloroflexota bacterium]
MIRGDGQAITVEGLTKTYGPITALRGADLTVPAGAVFGLLGPNGAGKSTMIKALVGALRPSAGTVRVLDRDPLRDRAALRQAIGYMPQSPALYDDLSARANIAFFGRAHDTRLAPRRVDAVLELTDLAARADDPVRTFSGGMQRRVSLACALVHEPRILFLDEPTAAVDPVLRALLGHLPRPRRRRRKAFHQHPPDGRGAPMRPRGGSARGDRHRLRYASGVAGTGPDARHRAPGRHHGRAGRWQPSRGCRYGPAPLRPRRRRDIRTDRGGHTGDRYLRADRHQGRERQEGRGMMRTLIIA